MSFKEKLEFENIEKDLKKMHAEKDQLTEKMNSGITDYTELSKISLRIDELNKLIDDNEMRWLELSEVVEK